MKISTLLVAGMVLLTGCSISLYEKGHPARIDRSVSYGKGELAYSATQAGEYVYLRAHEERQVKVARQTVYQTVLWKDDWSPLCDGLEILAIPILLPVDIYQAYYGMVPPETGDVKVPPSTRRAYAMASLTPGVNSLCLKVNRKRVVPEDRFTDPPSMIEYNQTLPVADAELTYRLENHQGLVIASGSAKTDMFGAILIPSGNSAPRWIEVRSGGRTDRVAVTPSLPSTKGY